jgi:hypothetical protein
MPGNATETPEAPDATDVEKPPPGRLGCACLTVKANPGALLVVLAILGCAAWWLWPLARFLLGW